MASTYTYDATQVFASLSFLATGGGIMAAVDDLSELVDRAAAAEKSALASKWKEESDVHRASWHRPGQRRPGCRVVLPTRPVPQRRGVCRPRWRQPARGEQRPH